VSDKATMRARLVELLAEIDFARRYYDFYQGIKGRPAMPGLGPEVVAAALETTGLAFKYDAREQYFGHKQKHERAEFGLNVAFAQSQLELILAIKTRHGVVGGSYALLAAAVERRRQPDFVFSPPYPALPFGDEGQLREVVTFGVELFEEIKRAVEASARWDE
jgi:hypothetical protein